MLEKRAFVRRKAAMDQRERRVTAQYDSSLRSEAVVERLRQAVHADDRRHPERYAQDEDAQTGKSAAQVAQRETRYRGPTPSTGRRRGRVHAGTRGAASIAPDRIRTIRSQRAAKAGS